MNYRDPQEFFKKESNSAARTAIFLSGSGTNAVKILDLWKGKGEDCSFLPVCIVTDHPETSRAEEISKNYGLPLVAAGIKSFYKSKGLETVSLASEKGRQVRGEWTTDLVTKLAAFQLDFGIFAGFTSLTNITDYFPCLNVHPGDLTVCDDRGIRILAGLHTLPILKAVVAGEDSLRSSVIIASAYQGEGAGMDEGLVAGISVSVEIDWLSKSREDWLQLYKSRPPVKPKDGWGDEFQHLLSVNLNRLKEAGDWVVFPKVVDDFAQGKFAYSGSSLFYKSGTAWLPIEIIEYSRDGKEMFFKEGSK